MRSCFELYRYLFIRSIFRKEIVVSLLISVGASQVFADTDYQAILDAGSIFKFDETYRLFNDRSAPNQYSTDNGNYGRNLGEQRLLGFKYALGILATNLRISQPINIQFLDQNFNNCNFIAAATYNYSWQSNDLPLADAIYPSALAEQILRVNVSGQFADINVTFNEKYFDGTCSDGFYYGFEPLNVRIGNYYDFIILITHELIHGMGFEARPSNSSSPFIFEKMLWAQNEQSIYASLNSNARNRAASKPENIVFNGRLTRKLATQVFDGKVTLTATNAAINLPEIISDIVNTQAVNNELIGQIVVFDTDRCTIDSDLTNKIVLFPSGCAREELNLSGLRFGALKKAQESGAIAAITSGELYDRFSTTVDVTIPVLSLPFEDYKTLVAVVSENASAYFSIKKNNTIAAGSDAFGRPIMFSGPNLAQLSRLLHFSPRVHAKPLDNKTKRNMMEPVAKSSNFEPTARSIDEVLPSLIDLGWAAHSCGNGRIDTFEECDDGDTFGGANCTQNCLVPGYCGDGVVDASEQCDNGGNNSDTAANGCSSICTYN